jgi:hypothetical protein
MYVDDEEDLALAVRNAKPGNCAFCSISVDGDHGPVARPSLEVVIVCFVGWFGWDSKGRARRNCSTGTVAQTAPTWRLPLILSKFAAAPAGHRRVLEGSLGPGLVGSLGRVPRTRPLSRIPAATGWEKNPGELTFGTRRCAAVTVWSDPGAAP